MASGASTGLLLTVVRHNDSVCPMTRSSTFVLVHGANLGGWCWDKVRSILETNGYNVLTPTLDLSGSASLSAHIDAVAGLMTGHDLSDVILGGHSYGGMVITGVADRLKPRLTRLVYLDAAVPRDGDDFASQVPGLSAAEVEERRRFFRSLSPDGIWLLPPPLHLVGITDPETIAAITPRLVPHPLATWFEPVLFADGGADGVPKTYVLATHPPTQIMGYPRHGEVAQSGGEWTFRGIRAGHAMMLAAPEQTAELLLEAAGSEQGGPSQNARS